METFHLVVAALTGTMVGSFLNVVIWRLPRGESLVTPRSRCPGCGKQIAWYDNIPLLSWALLGASCRNCRARISARYPFVEALTGALFAAAWLRHGGHLPTAALVSAALAALLAISVIDWEHKIIPDRITKPGIALSVALAPAVRLHPERWIRDVSPALGAWAHAAAGALAGAAVILGVRWLGYLVFRKEAMGLGDVKLLALIGALTGPADVLYVLVLACLAGAVIGGLRLAWARGRPLAFPLTARGQGVKETFESARITPEGLWLRAGTAPPVGERIDLEMVLPAAGILEDEDARVQVTGRLEQVRAEGDGHLWLVAVREASDLDRERLDLFAASYRYVPFGPFLALGGAAMLLVGPDVRWVFTEGWPGFVRGLFA